MRGTVLWIALASGVVVALGGGVAAAATKPPGLLQAGDLPGSFHVVQVPTASATVYAPVVDSAACTETPKPVPGTTGATFVSFGRNATAPTVIGLYENVLSFSSTKAAKSAFAQLSQNDEAAVKCGKVGFVPIGATTAGAPISIARLASKKVGSGSFSETFPASDPTVRAPTVTYILSGPYVAVVGTQGVHAPSPTELPAIWKKAVKRLPKPTPIPPPTSTSAATPR